jgi:hypothetical protein
VSASNNNATAATAAACTPELQFRSVSNRKAAGGSRNITREVGVSAAPVASSCLRFETALSAQTVGLLMLLLFVVPAQKQSYTLLTKSSMTNQTPFLWHTVIC